MEQEVFAVCQFVLRSKNVNILALETTDRTGSVAVAHDGEVLLEIGLAEDVRSAQSLAPGIRDLLARVAWQPADVDLVAVTVGPGSFTGLRIGVATAKAFAYAVGAEVLGIDTHEALALPCPPEVSRLHTVVDAQRGQVAARRFRRGDSRDLTPQGCSELTDLDAWLASLPSGASVTGPMLSRIASRIPANVDTLAAELWRPRAGNVARLAYRQHRAGRRDDLWRRVPVYTRLSAAEEKARHHGG